MTIEAIKAVAADLAELRPSAIVTMCKRADCHSIQSLDALVESLGFHGIGKRWRKINREQASSLLTRVLVHDQAYGVAEMEHEQAESLADRFLGSVPEPVEFFTNGEFSERGWSGYKVATGTFETGVGCVGNECVALLWVQDED